MPRVLIVRGHLVNPWELGPWAALSDEFEVSYLLTQSNRFGLPASPLTPVRVRALRDLLPKGRLGEVASALVRDRYLGADEAFAWADIVHAEELSFWFAAQAANLKPRHHFRLVQTACQKRCLADLTRAFHQNDAVMSESGCHEGRICRTLDVELGIERNRAPIRLQTVQGRSGP